MQRGFVARQGNVGTRVNVLRAGQYLGPEGPPDVSETFIGAGPPIGWVSILGEWGQKNGRYQLITPNPTGGSYAWSAAGRGVCGSDFEIFTSIKRIEPDAGADYNTALILATDLPTIGGDMRVSGYFFSFNEQGGTRMQLLRLDRYNFTNVRGDYAVLCDVEVDYNFGEFINFYLKREGANLIVGVNGIGACSFDDDTYSQFKSLIVAAAHAPGNIDNEVILRDLQDQNAR